MSVAPGADFTGEGGPDFRAFACAPFWFGPERRLLELQMTWGFAGTLAALADSVYPRLAGRIGTDLRLPGILARLGLLEYVRLTPKGEKPAALRRLIRVLLARGQRVFSFSYHSPSPVPGNTPYVRNERELSAFFAALAGYLEFFVGELGGSATTPLQFYQRCAGLQTPELESPLANIFPKSLEIFINAFRADIHGVRVRQEIAV